MSVPRRPHSFAAEDVLFESRTGPMRRDSDWGGHPRTPEEDVAWAAKRAAVSMAAATIHASSGGTGAHSDDVVHLCDAIAEELGIHGHDRAELLAAAQLHDVGKVAIPHEVLEKPGALDADEWALIREHTVAGERIVRSVPELDEVGRLVRHSHERWDGNGYPDGLAGESIPLSSRIVFCADAFHAIRSNRPYRRGRAAQEALEEVQANAGTQFDPEVVAALVKCARHMRDQAPPGARTNGTFVAATLRSRRLVSLLATLAIGGSALAAGGSFVLDEDEGDAGKRTVAPASSSARDAADDRGRSQEGRPSPARERAGQVGAASRGTPERSSRPDAGARGSTGASRRATPQPRDFRPTPAIGPQSAGRPASPGRSGEAPRRPAQPGRPVGGAPGRSEEAPGRPGMPVRPVQPRRAPQATAPRPPVAEQPGRAQAR